MVMKVQVMNVRHGSGSSQAIRNRFANITCDGAQDKDGGESVGPPKTTSNTKEHPKPLKP